MVVGQLVVDGFTIGLVFVLLAVGLVIITSVDKILFMAYGAFYMIGAYATWYTVYMLNLPYFLSLLLGIASSAILGMLSYVLIFNRLMRVEGGFLATLIASMGLSMGVCRQRKWDKIGLWENGHFSGHAPP
jgi:branched-chain amino acid transport system permease protein